MSEGGLSPTEVGHELHEHAKQTRGEHGGDSDSGRDRLVTIVEALLLAVVAVLAAWSGFASAKWATESRLLLAQSSTARTEASRAALDAMETRNFDASTFDAWFTAYTAGNQQAMEIAERRFRPEFKVAFDAWLATSPGTNPDAAPGPTYMPEYEQPDLELSKQLDEKADTLYEEGSTAGDNADGYVRTTVYLATVLFLVGISGHFRVRVARVGLIVVGSAILIFAVTLIIIAPRPPT